MTHADSKKPSSRVKMPRSESRYDIVLGEVECGCVIQTHSLKMACEDLVLRLNQNQIQVQNSWVRVCESKDGLVRCGTLRYNLIQKGLGQELKGPANCFDFAS